MATHNILGEKGEQAAVEYLIENGYQIEERNWRLGRFEIDIIATKNEEYSFVEVKTRSFPVFTPPHEAVNKGKIQRIVAAADAYIRMKKLEKKIHFDIITVTGPQKRWKITHWKDAFMPPLTTI